MHGLVMKLQEEIHRPEPFASVDQEALLNLLRIGDQLDNRLSRLFREHDLTLSRFNVLRSLVLAQRPLTCGEIADQMLQIVPGVTALVDGLENQGLVERERSTEDRRVVHVRITKRGKQFCEKVGKPLAELETRLFKGLSRSDVKTLIGLLEKTRESINKYGK